MGGPAAAACWWETEHPELERSFELTLAKMEADPRIAAKLATLPPLEVRPVAGPPIDAELWRRAMALEERCQLQFSRSCYLEWAVWQRGPGAKPRVTVDDPPVWCVSLLSRGSLIWNNYHVERPTLGEALCIAVERAPVAEWRS